MPRKAIDELQKWKNNANRKPLIIRGARQVGKTWLMNEFGRTQYLKVAYINFEGNERMQKLFSGDLDIGFQGPLPGIAQTIYVYRRNARSCGCIC